MVGTSEASCSILRGQTWGGLSNTKISQQPLTFLNIPKEIESAIHGKELNLEMPLHSSFIFLCVCLP